jgi:hypothetical protein
MGTGCARLACIPSCLLHSFIHHSLWHPIASFPLYSWLRIVRTDVMNHIRTKSFHSKGERLRSCNSLASEAKAKSAPLYRAFSRWRASLNSSARINDSTNGDESISTPRRLVAANLPCSSRHSSHYRRSSRHSSHYRRSSRYRHPSCCLPRPNVPP